MRSARSARISMLRRFEEIDVLIAHIANLSIRGVDQQCGVRKRPEQVSGRALHLAAIEPLVIVPQPENGRHAIVDGAHGGVGFDGDDREALQPVPGGTLPCVPESGEGIDRLVAQGEAEGQPVGLAPLVKAETGTRQRRLWRGDRQRLLLSRLSARALKVARFGSGPAEPKPTRLPAHPDQFAGAPVSRPWRMMGCMVLGAML
jgi:hypothetical protein